MTDLHEPFESPQDNGEKWIEEMKEVVSKKRCLACEQEECSCDGLQSKDTINHKRCDTCYFAPCSCKPAARMDQPWDMGYGV